MLVAMVLLICCQYKKNDKAPEEELVAKIPDGGKKYVLASCPPHDPLRLKPVACYWVASTVTFLVHIFCTPFLVRYLDGSPHSLARRLI